MLKKDPVENALIDADALAGWATGCTGLEKCSPQALRRVSKNLTQAAKVAHKSVKAVIDFYEKRKLLVAGPEGVFTGIVTKKSAVGEYYLCDEFGNPIFIMKMAPQYKRPKAAVKR